MKVCILSMQRVQNFGSLLQSYSLKKILENMGHQVSFIDIKKNTLDDELIEKNRILYKDEIDGKGCRFSKISKIDRYTLNRLLIKRLSNKQITMFNEFRKDTLKTTIADNAKHYDICVIGSDEVFNCMAKTPWGFTSQLFGNIEQADKVITYAASCGSTQYTDLPDSVKEKICETFKTVDAISVRDKNTAEFSGKLSDKIIYEHLDPVMVGDFRQEIEDAEDIYNLPSKICIVYSYYNRIHEENEIKAIKSFCKKQKLEIVTVGAPQMWVKKHLVLSPFQMLRVFQKADFVITDTFHGTIFSAMYASKFAIMIRNSNRNKLYDLICKLNLKDHLVDNMNQLQTILAVNKNTYEIENFINRERQNTEKYLIENIGCRTLYE